MLRTLCVVWTEPVSAETASEFRWQTVEEDTSPSEEVDVQGQVPGAQTLHPVRQTRGRMTQRQVGCQIPLFFLGKLTELISSVKLKILEI